MFSKSIIKIKDEKKEMEEVICIKECPFCGKIPEYNEKTQLVHCATSDCAIGDFYIHIDEWNKRNSEKVN